MSPPAGFSTKFSGTCAPQRSSDRRIAARTSDIGRSGVELVKEYETVDDVQRLPCATKSSAPSVTSSGKPQRGRLINSMVASSISPVAARPWVCWNSVTAVRSPSSKTCGSAWSNAIAGRQCGYCAASSALGKYPNRLRYS